MKRKEKRDDSITKSRKWIEKLNECFYFEDLCVKYIKETREVVWIDMSCLPLCDVEDDDDSKDFDGTTESRHDEFDDDGVDVDDVEAW